MNTSSASLSASESIGFFGAYGGQFVPDDLKARLDEVTEAFDRYSDNFSRTSWITISSTTPGVRTPSFSAPI
ncbi:MAG: hypothetical protein ACLSHC_17830 [Bilophila wadsworthia]